MKLLKTFCLCLCVIPIILAYSYASSERSINVDKDKQFSQKSNAILKIIQVDTLERVFPDVFPEPMEYEVPISVPRGGKVAFQFAVLSQEDAVCEMSVSSIRKTDGTSFSGTAKLYELLPVHVEANNNGGSRTSVDSKPPAEWMECFIRKAPFDVAEVLAEADKLQLKKDYYHAILVDVSVPSDARQGQYTGYVRLKTESESIEAPFSFLVHKTIVPAEPLLESTYWLQPAPENLTSEEPPEWWSERHWKLLENAGRQLRAFGQSSILTPLINYEYPLIQTIRQEDGSYDFDYTRFDRWVEMFLNLGFKNINGRHISSLHWMGVFVLDKKTGKRQRLPSKDREALLNLIPTFYKSFYKHLEEKGWTKLYIQHIMDEPSDEELYRELTKLTRKYMPGIRTMDAINSRPAVYSSLVDIQVFALSILAKEQKLANQRRTQGKSLWLYHCCSPYPPYPNRHLDERLTNSRLYPWLAYLLKAEGYLNWGANVYRGADPYKTSIGPVPGGSQNPGHPPGDNWFFYPGPDELRGSMRMVAFRAGLLDHTLLKMLAKKNQARADEIMQKIARTVVDYEKDPQAYHRARKSLLTALDEASVSRNIYQSNFEKDKSGFHEHYHYHGQFDMTLVPDKPGPSGAPSLRITMKEKSKSIIGTEIPIKRSHRWRIELYGASDITEGQASVALKCFAAKGKATWINVPWMGANRLPGGTKFQSIESIVELPASTKKVVLMVFLDEMIGSVWIADIRISELDVPPKMEAILSSSVPIRWGATGWFNKKSITPRKAELIEDTTLRDTGSKLLVTAGVTYARLFYWWDNLEPKREQYDFSLMEKEIAELDRYGAKPAVVCIHGTPAWAYGKTVEDLPQEKKEHPNAWKIRRNAFFPPRDWSDYERFVTVLVSHFKDKVTAWEVMNEPDSWYSGFNYDYKDYGKYLRVFYQAAKRADPDCHVMCGRVGAWLPLLLEDGMKSYFDSMSVHPYHNDPIGAVARVRKCQLTMVNGGVAKPVYVTEIGYSSGDWREGPGCKDSEQEKAEAGSKVLTKLSKITDMVIWYTAVQKGNMYGLIRNRGDRLCPMPIYYKMGEITGKLTKTGGPVKAEVVLPKAQITKDETVEVKLVATNISTRPQEMHFWPVGFVTNLGFTIEDVHTYDWNGMLQPYATHEVNIRVRPTAEAQGTYPVGLSVVTTEGNSLALSELKMVSK